MTVLLPFQKEGVYRMHACGGRALLADEQGLGKTLQWLTWLKEENAFPAVVVCPTVVKYHWEREAWDHCGIKSTILWGARPHRLEDKRLYILNWDILRRWLPALVRLRPRAVAGDEVQAICSLKSQRTWAFQVLCKGVEFVCGISGTPLTNKPWELFPVLNTLWPGEFPSPWSFGHRFCEAERSFGHWKFSGARDLLVLHKRLLKLGFIRRTKAEVLPQLPPITRTVQPLALSDAGEYRRAEENLISWLAEADLAAAGRAFRVQELVRFTYLKHLAAVLKLPAVLEWVGDYLSGSGGKLLLGTVHRDVLSRVVGEFGGGAVFIDGSRNAGQRREAENAFRRDPKVRLLVGQVKAAGVGLNLPEANGVAFAELPWTPAACRQFEARGHRLTSTRGLSAYYLPAHGTVEEKVCRILDRKQKILDQVLDGGCPTDDNQPLFTMLRREMLRGV